MTGFFRPRGILAAALLGVGASIIAQRVAPQVVPFQNLAVAGIVGGLPGVAGAYALQMFAGGGGTTGGLTYF